MSTRTIQGRPRELTDRKYHPVTRVLWPQVNRMANRTDLGMKVLEQIPAPALFDPHQADIVLRRSLIEHLDPKVVASPDFARKHPSLFGALVHEASHANQSRMDLGSIYRRLGARHHQTFSLLEEARCEVNNFDRLRPIERAGLRACVLEIVLRDVNPDDTEWESAVRFVGLLAGRVEKGIVDGANPTVESLMTKVREILGPHFPSFYALAVEFSRIEWSTWSDAEERMHDVVRRWMALEDSIAPEDKGEDEDEGQGQGQGQGQQGQQGQGQGQGQQGQGDEGQDEGSGGGSGEGQDEAATNGAGAGHEPGETSDESGEGSGEDDGSFTGVNDSDKNADGSRGVEGGDGGTVEVEEFTGSDHLGNYNHADYETVESLSDFIKELGEAVEIIKAEIMRSEIGPAIQVEYRATQEAHKMRRQHNREFAKKWSEK